MNVILGGAHTAVNAFCDFGIINEEILCVTG